MNHSDKKESTTWPKIVIAEDYNQKKKIIAKKENPNFQGCTNTHIQIIIQYWFSFVSSVFMLSFVKPRRKTNVQTYKSCIRKIYTKKKRLTLEFGVQRHFSMCFYVFFLWLKLLRIWTWVSKITHAIVYFKYHLCIIDFIFNYN